MNPYQKLANDIVMQAAKDFRDAIRYLRKHPKTPELIAYVNALPKEERKRSRQWRIFKEIEKKEMMLTDVERFFLSDWCKELTDADGGYMLMKLREEVAR